jgi:hypothetical protein
MTETTGYAGVNNQGIAGVSMTSCFTRTVYEKRV